ncbi:MAG: glucosamine-6-phosphate deaminase [Eubacteriales bacterium]|nr:glucosamine-6-phosphate deaminase [Eubacteriales bacterium]
MQVRIYKDAATVAKAAAAVFADEITKKDGCVIGLATGSTPVPTYQELIRLNKEGVVDFSKVISYNLDEYVGLAPDHPCSYRRFMNEQLFDHINIDKANTHVPDGLKCNTTEYEEMIHQAGGVDLQLLGIGTDGHIGFNEPADEFVYPTNVVKLTEGTRKDNARFFNSLDEVPTSAISMGIGTIMSARRILMIITGKNKADTVVAALKGPVVPQMPASILRMHQNVLVLLDEDAASKL